ncbi:phage tail protein [Paenibacillus sp. S25]|uniref:phage tail protein n=1 Tax=Paenibacillus sp. S25 TaxID=2823905 RepID=UPI001C646FCD|nr:phage tail protein [Paenibacillus sp. S25]QYK62425.1 Phage tail fiber repeat protein [Paenibacillus sp. S25]
MPIKQPRRFVTTDQGHADVLNVPIDTLYENDQALAEQIENIKNDPAGNDIASKAALDSHISDTNLHVTAAKQATWNATEGNAKKYTEQYAAPKAHTHPASDLPSASTQTRGIVQLNTSTGSTATDQAATPSAVKAANDRANEAYSRADQAFTQAVDLKNKIVGAINGKFGGASSDMSSDQIAAVITNAPVKRFASGTFNGQTASATGWRQNVTMQISVNSMGFTPSKVYVHVKLDETEGTLWLDAWIPCSTSAQGTLRGRMNNTIALYGFVQQSGGFTATMQGSYINDYAGGSPISRITAYEWEAYE